MNLFKRLFVNKRGFPKHVKGHAYCVSWYLHISDLRDRGEYRKPSLNPTELEPFAEDRVAFNHFRMGVHQSSDTTGLIDGLIPAMRLGDRVGLYKVTKDRYRDTSFYDGAMWDDGYMLDLKLVKVIRMPKALPVDSVREIAHG